jgi:hypothetical protein
MGFGVGVQSGEEFEGLTPVAYTSLLFSSSSFFFLNFTFFSLSPPPNPFFFCQLYSAPVLITMPF